MYYVKKTVEVAMAHRLALDYESKCTGLHGHNAMVTVWCRARELDRNGMVVDFSELKRVVKGALDHRFVNEVVDFNPTAENLARWLCERIPNCYKVSIRESEHNEATYERDE
ncbi:MAG: 6-carboxytetrahydropterin synthase [Bacteroidaceae bacterium]|jgi:6-pyruvoyltetrahydropterin/6-carboxytetrahydropterin synthase|nr:6-carboxytetrahydropterin synthase [Bacteroidaceae bacterium]